MRDDVAYWVFSRAGREFYNALREHGFVYPQILLIVEDHVLPRGLRGKDLSADDIARRAKFGLIEVPDEDRARAELRCRKNRRVAEKRRATIARERREADEVAPLWSPSQGRLFS